MGILRVIRQVWEVEVRARELRRQLLAVATRRDAQLAACQVAANGGTGKTELVQPESYCWSGAYRDVLALRRAYDELLARHLEHRNAPPLSMRDLDICARPGCRSPRHYNIHDPARGGHMFVEPSSR